MKLISFIFLVRLFIYFSDLNYKRAKLDNVPRNMSTRSPPSETLEKTFMGGFSSAIVSRQWLITMTLSGRVYKIKQHTIQKPPWRGYSFVANQTTFASHSNGALVLAEAKGLFWMAKWAIGTELGEVRGFSSRYIMQINKMSIFTSAKTTLLAFWN